MMSKAERKLGYHMKNPNRHSQNCEVITLSPLIYEYTFSEEGITTIKNLKSFKTDFNNNDNGADEAKETIQSMKKPHISKEKEFMFFIETFGESHAPVEKTANLFEANILNMDISSLYKSTQHNLSVQLQQSLDYFTSVPDWSILPQNSTKHLIETLKDEGALANKELSEFKLKYSILKDKSKTPRGRLQFYQY